MNTIKKTCLSSNLKNRDRKNVRNEEVAAKNKRKSHSLKYAANSGLKENKMKVGKLVHGLSDSMLLFFLYKSHAFKHNYTLLFTNKWTSVKILICFVILLY